METAPDDLKEKARKCLECPLCRRAREKQKGIAYLLVKYIDRKICPYGRALEKFTGQPAYEPIDKETMANIMK